MLMEWRSGKRTSIGAGGAVLEARMIGPSPDEAPTIVLLHEGLGSVGLWRDFPERLVDATGFGVFSYSRRGYGNSETVALPRPLDYLTREAVEVLPDVLGCAGFRRGILVGHSDGASIAALYLGHRLDKRVKGLVLMAPHFFVEPAGLAELRETRKAYEQGGLRERLAKHHRDVDAAFYGWNDAWLDPDFADWDVRDIISRIEAPVLAIQGEEDQYATLAQIDVIGERLNAPFTRLALPNCRHAPFLEKPRETIAAIQGFIADIGLSPNQFSPRRFRM